MTLNLLENSIESIFYKLNYKKIKMLNYVKLKNFRIDKAYGRLFYFISLTLD